MTLKTVYIEQPPLAREVHAVEDVCAFLVERFPDGWPAGARLYHGDLSEQADVTPGGGPDEITARIAHIHSGDGPFHVAVYPGDPGTFLSIIGLTLFNYAVSALLAPQAPDVSQSRRASSPNNELAARTNRARIGERIEDIYGEVRAIPSLIAQPYTFYVDGVEYEFAAFCLGRGHFAFLETPRDGDTPVTDIAGVKVAAYGPGRNPNAGSPATATWGGSPGRKIDIVARTAAINGQVLEAPNARVITFPSADGFDYQRISGSASTGIGRISCEDPNVDFVGVFAGVSQVTVTDGPVDYLGIAVNVDGTYTVDDVGVNGAGHSYIDLRLATNPSSNWAWSGVFEQQGGTVSAEDSVQLGPFTVGDADSDRLSINYLALSGLYKTDGSRQRALSVTLRTTVSKLGETDETFDHTLTGSGAVRDTIGSTHLITPTFSGPYTVRVERISDTDREAGFQVVDEVKIRDLYALAPSENQAADAFGDVTLITAQTQATSGALSVRERQLNMLVRRASPALNSSGELVQPTSDFLATKTFHQAIFNAASDAYIGGLTSTDVDWQQLIDTYGEVVDYFGFDAAGEFSHTFDDLSLSFEEIVQTIARACFCTAYRDPDDGGKLKLRFEKPQTDGKLIFNHRNTVPGTVARTTRFGVEDDHDGVEVAYVDSATDQQASVTLPVGSSPINPRRVRLPGLRGDDKVATLHAWRIWNKLQYANTRDDREVTDEAALLLRGERVEIADDTRPDTQAGEVLSQDGLTLTLSQPVTLVGGVDYVIILQHADGSTESLGVTAGASANQVTLGAAPKASLALGDDRWARALYWIVEDDATARGRGFVVEALSPVGPRGLRRQVTSINYDVRYYAHDQDYA